MPSKPLPINRVYLSHQIYEPAFDDAGEMLFYVRVVDAKYGIVRQCLNTGLAQTIATEPMPRGTVGYGGGIFAVRGNLLIYAAKDCRLYGIDLSTGEQWAVTPATEGVAAPSISPCGRFVAFLCELDGRCNVLVTRTDGKALLRGQWGVVDVEDARSGASHLVEAGVADMRRIAIMGASAGGYTTLMALTQQPDFWTAGVSRSSASAISTS